MEKSNPLEGCFAVLREWDEVTTNWSDNYYLEKEFSKDHLLTEDQYFEKKINNLIHSAYKKTVSEYNNMVSDNEKIDFLNGIFKLSDKLVKDYSTKLKAQSGKYAIEKTKELNRKLHYFYDSELYLLQVEKENISDSAKIKVDLNRTELVYLFMLLKDSDAFNANYKDYPIAKFISRSFLYFNKKKGKYTPMGMKSIKNFMDDIRSGEKHSPLAEERIKEIFKKSSINFK